MRLIAALACIVPTVLLGQIPPSEPLSPADDKAFHAELRRIEAMPETGADKALVQYALARTYAAGGQFQDAFSTLQQVVNLHVGLNPGNDRIFAKLRGTREFQQLLAQATADTPPIVHSREAFTITEADLVPEGIAYSPREKQFYLGSTLHHKIVACSPDGACRTLVASNQDGPGEVLGLRVSPTDGTLWAVANTADESALFHYSLPSGRLIRTYTISHKPTPHLFNDLVVARDGDVFVTDTAGAALYRLSHATDRLEIFDPALPFEGANGIAIADGPRPRLYVSSFPDGIAVVDVAARTSRPIGHPPDLCLASLDGLYYFDGDLVGIQNGVMTHRVIRCRLAQDGAAIASFEVLERRNPLFEVPTTGAIADDAFYFMANTQLDKVDDGKVKPDARFDPIRILRLDLQPATAQPDPWAPIRVFEGKWEGTVTGKPGTQFSRREYRFQLDGKFLSQRDDSVYDAKTPDGRQRTRTDFGFFSYDRNANKIVWRQFHSEGFVNEYTLESVSADGRSFEFVTRYIENQPPGFRAKKSYRIISPDEIEETFSLAPPAADFFIFTVAHLKRIP